MGHATEDASQFIYTEVKKKNFEEETIVHEQLKLMFPLYADAMIEELLRLTKK